MHAGTLGMLDEPADEALKSWRSDMGYPAIAVQDTLGKSGIQLGLAAARIRTTVREVTVSGTETPSISIDPVDTVGEIATKWIADVTETGIVVAESIGSDERFPFPFGTVSDRTGRWCTRQQIDVEALGDDWQTGNKLRDTWMVGGDDGTGASIQYHEKATDAREASIGLGFELAWDGSVANGVVYASGYLAIWNEWPTNRFVRFVDEEIGPYANPMEEDDDGEQQFLDEVGAFLDEEGYDVDRDVGVDP